MATNSKKDISRLKAIIKNTEKGAIDWKMTRAEYIKNGDHPFVWAMYKADHRGRGLTFEFWDDVEMVSGGNGKYFKSFQCRLSVIGRHANSFELLHNTTKIVRLKNKNHVITEEGPKELIVLKALILKMPKKIIVRARKIAD